MLKNNYLQLKSLVLDLLHSEGCQANMLVISMSLRFKITAKLRLECRLSRFIFPPLFLRSPWALAFADLLQNTLLLWTEPAAEYLKVMLFPKHQVSELCVFSCI